MATTTVNSTASLITALGKAHAGDTIQLSAGTYSGLAIKNVNFSSAVTIKSADPNHMAVITDFTVTGSSGLTFQNLEFFGNNPKGYATAQVNSSNHITFDHVSVHGSLDGSPLNDQDGIGYTNSSYINITNSELQQLGRGIVGANSDHIQIAYNTLHDIRSDGMDNAGVSNIQVSSNTFRDFYPTPADHPDAIQFWTVGTTTPAHDITVTNNLITRGAGTAVQGIFLADTINMPFQNVTIANNGILGTTYNGIAVFGATGLKLSNNTVQSLSGLNSWIRVESATNPVLSNNAASSYVYTKDTGMLQSNNLTTSGVSNTGLSDALVANYNVTLQNNVSHLLLTGTGLTGTANKLGHDVLTSLLGGNTLVGGSGNDTFHIFHSNDTIVVAPGTPNETVLTSASYTLPANVQNLTGEGTADLKLVGNAMDNVITGNTGSDTMTGGAGADTFVFQKHEKILTITDFKQHGDHDRIDISSFTHSGLTPTFKDHVTYTTVQFSTGEAIQLQGVHATDLHVSGDYII